MMRNTESTTAGFDNGHLGEDPRTLQRSYTISTRGRGARDPIRSLEPEVSRDNEPRVHGSGFQAWRHPRMETTSLDLNTWFAGSVLFTCVLIAD